MSRRLRTAVSCNATGSSPPIVYAHPNCARSQVASPRSNVWGIFLSASLVRFHLPTEVDRRTMLDARSTWRKRKSEYRHFWSISFSLPHRDLDHLNDDFISTTTDNRQNFMLRTGEIFFLCSINLKTFMNNSKPNILR